MRRRTLLAAAAAAIALPSAGRAESAPVVGFLHGSALSGPYPGYVKAFLGGLKEQGFEPGPKLAIEYRWAEGKYDRIAALATDLVALHPAVVVVYGPPSVVSDGIAAIPRTIPVVFGTGGDPVAAGIVASLARPDGNVTGIANRTNSLDVKRLEILRDLLPQATTIGMIFNPKNSDAPAVTKAALEGARSLGRRLVLAGAGNLDEIDRAFTTAASQGAAAVLMASDTYFNALADRIVRVAERHRLPAIYNFRPFAEAGGLVSYGANLANIYRLIGSDAGRILKGAKPADMPVVEPTLYELVLNLKTARALGLTVPQSILARADEVIE